MAPGGGVALRSGSPPRMSAAAPRDGGDEQRDGEAGERDAAQRPAARARSGGAGRGASAGGGDERELEVADEVVAHGLSSRRARMPARPRETRLRITDSDVRAARAISS